MKKWLQKLGQYLFGESISKMVEELLRRHLVSVNNSLAIDLEQRTKMHEGQRALMREQMAGCVQEVKQMIEGLKPVDLRSLREPGMFYSEDGRFGIRCNTFPNKDIIEFGVSVPLYDDKKESAEFSYPDCETSSFASITGKLSESQIRLAGLIFETKVVAKVRIEPFAVNVTKTPAISQTVLKEAVVKAIFAFLDETQPKLEPVPAPDPAVEVAVEENLDGAAPSNADASSDTDDNSKA